MVVWHLPRQKNRLAIPKGKLEIEQRSEIYEINCNSCDKKYICQSKRPIRTRFKEHMLHFRYKRSEKFSVAQHMLTTGHKITLDNLKMRKAVSSNRELDAIENMYIHKNRYNLLNSDSGPLARSELYRLLTKLLLVSVDLFIVHDAKNLDV